MNATIPASMTAQSSAFFIFPTPLKKGRPLFIFYLWPCNAAIMIEMTSETPSKPMIKIVIGERSEKNCEI